MSTKVTIDLQHMWYCPDYLFVLKNETVKKFEEIQQQNQKMMKADVHVTKVEAPVGKNTQIAKVEAPVGKNTQVAKVEGKNTQVAKVEAPDGKVVQKDEVKAPVGKTPEITMVKAPVEKNSQVAKVETPVGKNIQLKNVKSLSDMSGNGSDVTNVRANTVKEKAPKSMIDRDGSYNKIVLSSEESEDDTETTSTTSTSYAPSYESALRDGEYGDDDDDD